MITIGKVIPPTYEVIATIPAREALIAAGNELRSFTHARQLGRAWWGKQCRQPSRGL